MQLSVSSWRLVTLSAFVLVTACTDKSAPAAPTDAAVSANIRIGGLSIEIVQGPATMTVGDTATFVAKATDLRGRPIPANQISWTSSKPRVLKLRDGVATAVEAGTVTVYALFWGGVAKQQVVVRQGAPLWAWRSGAAGPVNGRAFYTAHDPARREILIANDDNRIITYNIANDTWGEVPVSGMPSPPGEYQIAYDQARDRILFEWRGLGSVYALPRTGGVAQPLGSNGNGYQYFDHVFGVDPVTTEPFAMAGYGFFTFHNTFWRFTASNQWVAQPIAGQLPWPRQAPTGSVASAQRALYLFGGQGNPSGSQSDPLSLLHSLWKLDFTTGAWTSLIPDAMSTPASAPTGRLTAMGVTPTGSAVYLYGPENSPSGVPFQTLWRLRPGMDAAFSAIPTTGAAPTTLQTAHMFYDEQSQDMIVVLRDAPLQVYRIRVQQ